MDLYAENILDHARHPHRKELLEQPTVERKEINASCGDALTLHLHFDRGKLTDVGWTGTGCAISQASMSLLAEELLEKTEDELDALGQGDVLALLGVDVGPRRLKCALLSLHTLKNALRKMREEEPQGWVETLAEKAER